MTSEETDDTEQIKQQYTEAREKARNFLAANLVYPFNAPEEKWNEKEFCLEAICLKRNAYRLVPDKFWHDKDFCLEAVKRNYNETSAVHDALEWIYDDTLTEEMCLIAVNYDGFALQDISQKQITEKVIMQAVTQNGKAIQFVPKWSMKKIYIETAIKQNREAIAHIPEEWKSEAIEAIKCLTW